MGLVLHQQSRQQFHLGLVSVSDRSKSSVRISLSDVLLTFHLLVKSSQYLLD